MFSRGQRVLVNGRLAIVTDAVQGNLDAPDNLVIVSYDLANPMSEDAPLHVVNPTVDTVLVQA